jgi:hypothetical protein
MNSPDTGLFTAARNERTLDSSALAVAGIAMTAGFGWLEKRLVPWTKD